VRYLILSDIHANWEALEAVLRDAEGDWDQAVCCGDLVGYGADPNRVIEWVREHAMAVVRGNHDKACAGLADLEGFNPAAREAAEWTAQTLTADQLYYLRNLPQGPLEVAGFEILHGSPADEDEYLMAALPDLLYYLHTPVAFFGHTHWQGGFVFYRNSVQPLPGVPPEHRQLRLSLRAEHVYLINPGSVGQPRDRDPRAAYAVYDDARQVELRRTPYRVEVAQAKIRRAGLPEILADRLSVGF